MNEVTVTIANRGGLTEWEADLLVEAQIFELLVPTDCAPMPLPIRINAAQAQHLVMNGWLIRKHHSMTTPTVQIYLNAR